MASSPAAAAICGNGFCEMLNADHPCWHCQAVDADVMRSAPRGVVTRQCQFGLAETAIPVRLERATIAILRTGRVRFGQPGRADLKAVAEAIAGEGRNDSEVQRLAEAYRGVPVKDDAAYDQAVTMLAIFSLHLTSLIRQLKFAGGDAEPSLVTRAKLYIQEHLGDKISLGEVAGFVGVSPFYFCKVFKESTGTTFTAYMNQLRVAWAKTALTESKASVTEIAYDVGYQSLSQFNRSFRKLAGMSPSEYRNRIVPVGSGAPPLRPAV